MMPMPVMQLINFFYLTVIDNVNILKINVKLKHQFTAHLEKILHKLPLCTLKKFDIDYLQLQPYGNYDLM